MSALSDATAQVAVDWSHRDRSPLQDIVTFADDVERVLTERGLSVRPASSTPTRAEVRRAVVVADARYPRDVEKLADAVVDLLAGRGPTCGSGDGHAGPCCDPATGLWRGAEERHVLLCDRHARRWADCGWVKVRRL